MDRKPQTPPHPVLHIAENDQFCPAPAREAIVGALSGRADTQVFV
jgi:hypothetical protein